MNLRHRQQDIGSEMALIALVLVAFIVGIAPIVDAVVQAVAQSKADVVYACRACGVVEDVREVKLESAKNGGTVRGDGLAMVLALLHGRLGTAPVQVYEVEVLLQDGSVRVIREATTPAWKPGDHVKVTMGKVKPAL